MIKERDKFLRLLEDFESSKAKVNELKANIGKFLTLKSKNWRKKLQNGMMIIKIELRMW